MAVFVNASMNCAKQHRTSTTVRRAFDIVDWLFSPKTVLELDMAGEVAAVIVAPKVWSVMVVSEGGRRWAAPRGDGREDKRRLDYA